jgi:sterol desaturase/sphingolipid hydroxylase (fatty acid hydroxylase superfamily)
MTALAPRLGAWYASELSAGAASHSLPLLASLLGLWLLFCGVFEATARTGALDGRKLQPHSKTSGAVLRDGLRGSLRNWAGIAVTAPLAGPLLAAAFPYDAVWPSAGGLAGFALLSLAVFNTWFYAYHRTLHVYPALYQRFHKEHHHLTATFVWMSHAQHPLEILLNGIGTLGGPLIWRVGLGLPLPFPLLLGWLALVQLFGVLEHCGYDLPISPLLLVGHLPGFNTVKDHDEHHRRLTVAYGGAPISARRAQPGLDSTKALDSGRCARLSSLMSRSRAWPAYGRSADCRSASVPQLRQRMSACATESLRASRPRARGPPRHELALVDGARVSVQRGLEDGSAHILHVRDSVDRDVKACAPDEARRGRRCAACGRRRGARARARRASGRPSRRGGRAN